MPARSGPARSWRTVSTLALALGLCLSILVLVRPARAATLTVTTTQDELNADGDCSLREAIRAANLDIPVDRCPAGAGSDTITLAAGTYLLTLAGINEDAALSGDLDITSDLAITGAGAATTIIDSGQRDRIADIPGAHTVTIADVTLQNGGTPWPPTSVCALWIRDAGAAVTITTTARLAATKATLARSTTTVG